MLQIGSHERLEDADVHALCGRVLLVTKKKKKKKNFETHSMGFHQQGGRVSWGGSGRGRYAEKPPAEEAWRLFLKKIWRYAYGGTLMRGGDRQGVNPLSFLMASPRFSWIFGEGGILFSSVSGPQEVSFSELTPKISLIGRERMPPEWGIRVGFENTPQGETT